MFQILLLAAAQAASTAACAYDRGALMTLDEQSFDQGPTGWRALSTRGCDREAANLIRDWRNAHPDLGRRYLSFWHEGQLRANVGQTVAAIALFDRSRKTVQEDAGFGWNHYVDGSIAFLRRDRRALNAARAKLAAIPRPVGFDPRGPDGKPMAIAWPMNLNVLDGFQRCWARSYKIAYGPGCSAPMRVVTVPGE